MSEFELQIDEIETMRIKAHKSKKDIATYFGWTPNYVYQLFGKRQQGPAVERNLKRIQKYLADEMAKRYEFI